MSSSPALSIRTTPARLQVLVADDEPNLRRVLSAQLTRDGFDVLVAEDGEQALEMLQHHHVDVLVTDLKMPRMDGMTLLARMTAERPELPVVVITAHGTVDTAVEALKLGAFDYVTKPFDRDEFKAVIDKATRTRALRDKHAAPLAEALPSNGRFDIVGQSQQMQQVFTLIEKVAATPSTVLITGESGTGKELVARALHVHSTRKDKPFIRVNCAAIPSELMESELFGYERGAFTGAVNTKPGRFELAHGGTLFLDEIGEISPAMQVKLLRAIQEQEFEHVGGVKTLRVDVRLVAATNRDLAVEIQNGRFREDLFYRLNVVQVALPPLRQRISDIPLLIEMFLARYSTRLGKAIEGVDKETIEALSRHHWPGNIRELENVIERCVLFADEKWIRIVDVPAELQALVATATDSSPGSEGAANKGESLGLKELVKEASMKLERDFITRALIETGDNVTRAAQLLKISRKSLQLKMKELGLRDTREDG